MQNRFLFYLLIGIFVAVAIFEGAPQRISNWVRSSNGLQGLFSHVSLPESLSGPLRGPLNTSDAKLTAQGVVDETNKQRGLYQQIALHLNTKLTLAAQAKVDDMFKQQYFEHISPDGNHPADIIKAAGYEYLIVGENLALGNYPNDQALVEAWMNSPGHRANILDGKFDEIGVAVGKGMFEGKEVWLAVQEFGTPLSSCPNTSASLKSAIEANRQKIQLQETEINQQKDYVNSMRPQSGAAYEQAVAKYNSMATELNKLIDATKVMVDQYNAQVNSFNQCLEKNG